MTLRNFIVLLGLLLFSQCHNRNDSAELIPFSTSNDTQLKSHLEGRWRYSIPFYHSDLTLQDDSTFTFHDQGHYGQRFTKGRWTENGIYIVLTSFQNFRLDTSSKESAKSYGEQVQTKSQNREQDSSYYNAKVPPPVLPGRNDTILIFFDSVFLKFEKDTLYPCQVNEIPENAKFHRTDNNR